MPVHLIPLRIGLDFCLVDHLLNDYNVGHSGLPGCHNSDIIIAVPT